MNGIITPLTTFTYPTHPGPIIILGGTNTHANSNMRIAQTKEVHLFHEVMVAEQALVQQIIGTVEEAYLAEIHNRKTNSINNTVACVLTYLQDKKYQLILHKLM